MYYALTLGYQITKNESLKNWIFAGGDNFANIFDRAYTFANTYPNIRHTGNQGCVRRELRREDALLSALLFVGLSACAHDLCTQD